MPYSDEAVRRQLRLGEDSNWEFKEIVFVGNRPKSPQREDWADEIAAFANTNGGVLLCGITDAGDVQGLSRPQMDEVERLISEVCTNLVNPLIRVNIFRKEITEGKSFLLVEVPEGHAPHDSPGGSYIRVGSTKRKIAGDERLRLAQRRGQARFLWFDKQPVPETGFGTLDEALWRPLLSAESAADPELALEKMGLLAPDVKDVTRATVAGVLLCSNSPERWLPNACIIATRYRGVDKASGQLDTQIIGGPINRQITDALAFAVRNMSIAAHKNPARRDIPQYSKKVLFEALVNAVVHRDYSIRGSRIRLSMFENRLELCSPGPLPNNLTIESMGDRQSTRNEVLTSVLGRVSVVGIEGTSGRHFFMERRGDGVPIIQRETWELCGTLPDFRLIDGTALCLAVPAASLESTPTNAVITVHSGSEPLADVDVLTLFPNKTWKRATTNDNGEAVVDLHVAHLPMTVFAAAKGFAAQLELGWVPSRRSLTLNLNTRPEGGSVIFPEATGSIPGLTGRLNPIRDEFGRTYLYASNITINAGVPQPVNFIFGEELSVTDANGMEATVRIMNVMGQSVLLEYSRIAGK